MKNVYKSPVGSSLIILKPNKDIRGSFLKIFNKNIVPEGPDIKEVFRSVSAKNVLRGIHFQSGESACSKLIFCSKGSVLDVVIDLRRSSPHFNKPIKYNLSAIEPSILFVPEWCGHGFLSLTEDTEMYYMTSHAYDPTRDRGILWSSINFNWPTKQPILSERDMKHPSIDDSKYLFM